MQVYDEPDFQHFQNHHDAILLVNGNHGHCQTHDDTCNNYVVSTCQICVRCNIINKLNPGWLLFTNIYKYDG